MARKVNPSEDAWRRVAAATRRVEAMHSRTVPLPPAPRSQNYRILLKGKAAESIAAGGTGTFIVWDQNTSGEVETDEEIEAIDWLETGFSEEDRAYILCIFGEETEYFAVRVAAAAVLGKTDAAHAKGASGTISVYSGTPGSETDTTENITAFNKFADLASGKWVAAIPINGHYYLVAGEC